jgi:hypothetical protein
MLDIKGWSFVIFGMSVQRVLDYIQPAHTPTLRHFSCSQLGLTLRGS